MPATVTEETPTETAAETPPEPVPPAAQAAAEPANFPDGGRVDVGVDATVTPSGKFGAFVDTVTAAAPAMPMPMPDHDDEEDDKKKDDRDEDEDMPPMADADGVPYTRWRALAAIEGVWTGDNRIAERGAWSWRDLPLTLKVQTDTTVGHDGAKLVGRIDTAEVVDASGMVDSRTGEPYGDGAQAVMMTGVFNNRELAVQTVEDIRGGFLGGVSADPSDVNVVYELADAAHNPVSIEDLDSGTVDPADVIEQERWTAARFMGLTITPFPAWEGTYIEILDDEGKVDVTAGPGVPDAGRAAVRASVVVPNPRRCLPCESGAVTASVAPVEPPRAWFDRGERDGYDRRIFVTDEGRVFGYVAPWGVCHIGYPGKCVPAPRSATSYSLFHLGSVKTTEGDIIPTGVITVDTGHEMNLHTGVAATVAHYDNTGTAVADVAVGEDDYGIWFSGALRPDATPEQVRKLRGSKISGDWRPWGVDRELVAALAVNVPGLPVTGRPAVEQLVASAGALIASFWLPSPRAVPPELDEVRSLLPELRGIAERDRAGRAAGARERMATSVRAGRVTQARARMGVGG